MNSTKQVILLVFLLLYSFSALTAQTQRTCGAMEYMKKKWKYQNAPKPPAVRPSPSTTRSIPTIITIPTVVHVLYNNPLQNISDAQILSQIQVLNEDFRRMNADAVNTPADFLGIAADVEIEFYLASVDPNGFATSGITRTASTVTSFGISDQIKSTLTGGQDAWNTGDYLNIWVGPIGGGILGYAQFPGANPATDGVVIDYRYFGTTGTATPPFELGRTATHEVGHWLGLAHIWGDGGCGVDDGISDTPLAGMPNYTGAPCTAASSNTCTEAAGDLPDMFQNFMDYSDDGCMNLFTIGQKNKMRSLFEPDGQRVALLSSTGLAADGKIPTCMDGFKNGTETGIDCGGSSCLDCAIFCEDGLLNGQETAIDCGGVCKACPPGPSQVCEVAITLTTNDTYAALGPFTGMGANQSTAMHANWYRFIAPANGSISLSSCGEGVDTRVLVYEGCCNNLTEIGRADDICELFEGGNLWAASITNLAVTKGKQYYIEWDDRWSTAGFDFDFSFSPIARCADGIQNGDETGIDCGGTDCQPCNGLATPIAKNVTCNDNGTNDNDTDDFITFDLNLPGSTSDSYILSGVTPATGVYGQLTSFQTASGTAGSGDIYISIVDEKSGDCLSITITDTGSCSILPIPSMSQWGLMLFGLLILNLGLILVYRLDNVRQFH